MKLSRLLKGISNEESGEADSIVNSDQSPKILNKRMKAVSIDVKPASRKLTDSDDFDGCSDHDPKSKSNHIMFRPT